MKGFALILLCVVALAQARSALQGPHAVPELGENPWFVHLRIAVATSGFLNTCAGSLIGHSWILTAKQCVTNPDSRFIWTRYGVVDVYRPSLVTEGNHAVRLHPTQDIALINVNRVVHYDDNIKAVPLASSADEVDSAKLCVFGAKNSDAEPGEALNCGEVSLELADDVYVASSDAIQATRFDLGAPLVKDGKQIGVLTAASWQNAGSFVSVASVLDWIQQETGVSQA